MSCNYADGLSPYDDKGVLGVPEKFDTPESVDIKCKELAELILNSKHVVVHTGAGISTTAGIPDFRGPNGVWTLEKKGLKPNINISFDEAIPTKTHMALKKLVDQGYVKFIVSQNIDGLHLKTGLARKFLAELHGNMFVEQCNTCERQFVRNSATTSVGQKSLDKNCQRSLLTGRNCRGKLHDTILDWEANLPDNDLDMSNFHSHVADLNICLGTTLQIVPSGNLPLKCKKYGGKLVVVNLQPTKHDKKADLIINYYVDDVMEKVMKYLGLEIDEYQKAIDPTKDEEIGKTKAVNWSILTEDLDEAESLYELYCKNYKKRKAEIDKLRDSIPKKVRKVEIKEDIKEEAETKDDIHVNENGLSELNRSLETGYSKDQTVPDEEVKKEITEETIENNHAAKVSDVSIFPVEKVEHLCDSIDNVSSTEVEETANT